METRLHEKLPLTKVLPITSELAYSLEGPDVLNGDGELMSYEDLACAWSISTYPHIPERPDREGDPICDRFSVYGYANRALVVFTDGCNWGMKSKGASYRANSIFAKLMKQSLDEITDLRKAGFCLLRALDEAHYGIIQTNTELNEAGSTTILGGLLLQVEGMEKKKNLLGVGGSNDKKPKWVYLCLSVGDCKTYHYSQKSGKFTDVTKGNRRAVNDPCDPGGRIGLYVENERPDLRNIAFYITECEEDDILFVVSDGVHDNFDAQFMGIKPKDLNLPMEAWEENVKNPEEVTDKKHKWVVELLDRMFKDEVSPQVITRRVIEHARGLTKKGREFTEQNPMKRVPRDEVLYTGKMDHTTCCAIKVSTIKGAPDRKARPPVPPRRSANLTPSGVPSLLQPTVSSPSLGSLGGDGSGGGKSGGLKRAVSQTIGSSALSSGPRASSPHPFNSVSSSALPTYFSTSPSSSSPSVT
jgi:hypothetical protein